MAPGMAPTGLRKHASDGCVRHCSHISGSRDQIQQRFPELRIWELENSGTEELRNSRTQELRNLGTQELRVAPTGLRNYKLQYFRRFSRTLRRSNKA